jgi:2',3'-cyclic-nucleotide 2'-phosphodiesterase/3'-nucleotidase
VLETTDLHSNVVGYDYFKLAEDPSLGLDRTAALIAQARRDYPNTLLLDNGDTIQGNALGDVQATVQPVRCGQLLAIHKVMKKLGYDGAGVGNHDFNFGLGYLAQVTGQRVDVPGVEGKRCAGTGLPGRAGERLQRQDAQAPVRAVQDHRKARQGGRRRRAPGRGDWSRSASSASPRPPS